jgi:XTP/dITP diphosphohydrolase
VSAPGRRIVFATRNAAKLRELRELLSLDGVELISLAELEGVPEIPEEGTSFAENAAAKALGVMRATGLPAIADDSGLEVDALGGGPGVHSARYAGTGASDDQRIALLLRNLAGVPRERRTARFRCAVAFAAPELDAVALLCEGSCEGAILEEKRGSGGFGYDPVFLARELGQTFAEASAESKHRVSHRGRAMRSLAPLLRQRLAPLAEPLAPREHPAP